MRYFLAEFEERIGEVEVLLSKIVKAENKRKAWKLAEKDAEENSCYEIGWERIRRLKGLQEIKSIDDIPVPFMIKEE